MVDRQFVYLVGWSFLVPDSFGPPAMALGHKWGYVTMKNKFIKTKLLVAPLLVLSSLRAAFTPAKKAAARGCTSMADLRAVVDLVGEWVTAEVELHFR